MSLRDHAARALAALAALTLGGCTTEESVEPTPKPQPTLGTAEQVVPFASPPAGVVTQDANNNLDVVAHDGKVFLAFRTAPTHFASDQTEMYVVSSTDEKTWQFEAKFALGTDVREPRLLSWDGQLFLYLAVLGKNPLKFEPQGVKVAKYEGPGQWSEPVDTYEDEFILWRSKVVNGTPYAVGYVGGDNIYNMTGDPITIHFLTTQNGFDLEPVVPGKPVVQTGGGSETDFVIQDDGSLIAVTRNEAGDETGWGSKICKAAAGDFGNWHCEGDKRKYDSPLVFRHGQRIFLIGRRQLANDGLYDLGMRDLDAKGQTGKYEVEYSFSPKRCSLWEVDPKTLTVSFVLDLPSMGDTCFPGLLDKGDGKFVVYNYTSPLEAIAEGEEWKWIEGQSRPTVIYRVELTMP